MNQRFPCIFIYNQTREVDDTIQAAWKERFGQGAPFGSLRKEWRRAHCRTINPYGSERCPFQTYQCIAAFQDAVLRSLQRHILDPRVYFISVAKSSALERADNKPLAREAHRITSTTTEGPGPSGVVGSGRPPRRSRDLEAEPDGADVRGVGEIERRDMRRPLSRPVRIGDLLRPSDR